MSEREKNLQSLLQELGQAAEDAYETKEDAAHWLQTPHPILDEKSPLQMGQSQAGMQRVKDILLAIKYGGAV